MKHPRILLGVAIFSNTIGWAIAAYPLLMSNMSSVSPWLLGTVCVVLLLGFFVQGYALGYSRGFRSCTQQTLGTVAAYRDAIERNKLDYQKFFNAAFGSDRSKS